MKSAACPHCKQRAGEVRERAVVEPGLRVVFGCLECDYSWTVDF